MTVRVILDGIEQGSEEWLKLRKTKITATDAPPIMGVSPWKNLSKLYQEKISEKNNTFITSRMQRGIDLEPIARDLFTLQTGIVVQPMIVSIGWAMASLDGFNQADSAIVEIKCPSNADHSIALSGKIPNHYYPQLQHQIYVTGFSGCYYFSFDGIDGVAVFVERDDEYIDELIKKEKEFYECLINRTPPFQNDYIQRNDKEWEEYAQKWKQLTDSIKFLEKEEELMRKHLIDLGGSSSHVKGGGISLCQITRKGMIDYSRIPELKTVDIEKYRKESTTNWRITTE